MAQDRRYAAGTDDARHAIINLARNLGSRLGRGAAKCGCQCRHEAQKLGGKVVFHDSEKPYEKREIGSGREIAAEIDVFELHAADVVLHLELRAGSGRC